MNNKLYKSFLFILGLSMFIAFIWFRFIRSRIPKEIPFNLSLLGFCILISICSIFIYIIISLIRQSKPMDSFMKQMMDAIYIPLKTFDHYIKNLSYTNNTYKYGINFLAYLLGPLIINSTLFYYLFMIIPRLILLTTLFIDVFYFHKLLYIYKILLIGIFIFLGKYIIYSFKYAKDHFIESVKHYIAIAMAYEDAIQIIEPISEEEEEDICEMPTLIVPFSNFIEFQTMIYLRENSYHFYIPAMRSSLDPYFEENNILYSRYFTCEEVQERINNILKISLILAYYDIINNNDKSIKILKILIYLNYFLCWFYILLISLPSLYYASFWELWIIFSIQETQDPFSLLECFSIPMQILEYIYDNNK